MTRGVFVAFEGLDGCGKSTAAAGVATCLQKRLGKDRVCLTCEPTQGRYGRQLRESFGGMRLNPEEELLLFLQDREEHVREIIEPELGLGKVVLTDRYYLSTIAYQSMRGFEVDYLERCNERFPQPDLTILIDIPVSVALERIMNSRGEVPNSFEGERTLEHCKRVYDAYASRCEVISGEQPISTVIDLALKRIVAVGELPSDAAHGT